MSASSNGHQSSNRYTLAEARLALSQGIRFGDIYPNLANPDDGDELKRFFVYGHTTDTPLPLPTEESMIALKQTMLQPTITGDFCNECGSVNMVRTGSCKTCQDCGRNEGCG